MPHIALNDLERTRTKLFLTILFFIRTASTAVLLLGLLSQAVPALRIPAVLLLLGVVAATLLLAGGMGYLTEQRGLRSAVVPFTLMVILLSAMASVILQLPAIYMGVAALTLLISAFMRGAAATMISGVIGVGIFIGVLLLSSQPWIEPLTISIDPAAQLILQIVFIAAIIGVIVATGILIAERFEQSLAESATRATEAEKARAEQATLVAQLGREVKEQQALLEIVQQLEVPVIALADRVIALPLVGNLDSRRFDQIERRLLNRLASERIDLVLTDLTTVVAVDTAIAARLLRIGQTVRLLGVEMALTGIKPAVAQTIVALGVESLGMRSYASMQDALSAQMLDRSL